MAGKFEMYKDNGGEFRFRLKAGNGENILASEGYKAKASCENGIASVQKNAADEGRFEVKEQSNGKPYFVLKAGNGEVIGKSQAYESEDSCKNGIESVMRNAADASIDDQTG
ncbi:MAG: YegP family protein [Pseudomonadota bacterium]